MKSLENPKKSAYAFGSLLFDTLADPENPTFQPDKHDYSFLSEEWNFQIGKNAKLVKKLMLVLEGMDMKPGSRITPDVVVAMARPLAKALGLSARRTVLVELSLSDCFMSRMVDDALLFDIAARLAGNINILDEDQVIVGNYSLEYPVWVPFTVEDMDEAGERPGHAKVDFRADAGIMCGTLMRRTMSFKAMRFVLSQIGGSYRRRLKPRDMFGVKLSILLANGVRGMDMLEFSTSSSQLTYNRALFKVRGGPRPCHEGEMVRCSDCVKGVDVCEFADYKNTEAGE